jgi:hypothetical protein
MAVVGLLSACSSVADEEEVVTNIEQTVTLTFSPYEQEAMTRTATSIAGVVTALDVWVMEGDNTIAAHQTDADANFGSLSITLNKTKTYTVYAVGHKCTAAATLSNGVISFPEDKVTHSLFYTATFSPATTTSLSCIMTRIVSMFRLETTDAVPNDAKKMRFTIKDVYNRWNVNSGGTNLIDRVSTVNISSTNQDGTVAFSIYSITTDASTNHNILVEALDSNDDVIQSRSFENVPLRNGYKTTYRGAFFVDQTVTSNFMVDDWSAFDTVNF